MALTANRNFTATGHDYFGSWVVANGATIYKGAMVGLVVGTGTVTNYDDAAGHLFVGYATKKVVGDGSLKIGVQTRGDIIEVAVTGASAATDNGAAVYSTDESVFTLARPSDDGQPTAVVAFWVSSTTCKIMLLGLQASVAMQLAGGNKRTLYLGHVGTRSLEGTAATNIMTAFTLWGHGKIVDFYAYPDDFDASYTTGNQNLNLEIGGTDVTGGVLNLLAEDINAAADRPVRITSTAITAANEFHDGDTIDVELAAAGVGFDAGIADGPVSFCIFIDVEYMAGN